MKKPEPNSPNASATAAPGADATPQTLATVSRLHASRESFAALLRSRHADGSFRLSNETLRLLGLDAIALETAAEFLIDAGDADAVVHTAVALALFHKRFGAHQQQWREAADAALRWLLPQSLHYGPADGDWQRWAGEVCDV